MRIQVVALASLTLLSACATTSQQQATTEECAFVDDDATGSKITRKQECKDVPAGSSVSAPQR